MSFTKHFGQAASGSTATDRITAFTSTGFTVGASTLVNSSTIKYNYLAIKAVAGEIAVGNYSGDGVDNRNLTGVGFQPDLVLTMSSTGATSTWRTSEMTADESMFWDLTPAADLIQGLLADGFQVGTDARVNGSGGTYHYIACKNVTGKFKVGSYTGTGGGQSFTGLGFAPEGLFIKRNGSTIGNLRFASTGASASADVTLQPNSSWYATNAILSLDADGFTIGTAGNRINGTTAPNTYHWFAFAEATTASASAPTVASPTKASITHNSATLGGNVTADGGAALSERGVVYSMTSINSNPEIGGIGVTKAVASGTTTGVFTAAVSGLVFSTGYTYKAYATNSAGTSYSSADSLTTAPAPVAVVNLNRANATPSNAATVNWTLTLASAVTGMTAANFELTGAAAAGASVGTPTTANAGLTWTVPVTTGGTDGELTLRLANATGLSVAVNGLPYTGQSYTMDKTPPQVQSVVRQVPAGQTTSATSLVFRVTYTEAVTGVGTGRFALQAVNGGTVTGTVTGVTPVSASVYDVAVSVTGGDGEFRLRVLD